MRRIAACIVMVLIVSVTAVPVIARAQEDDGWNFTFGTMLWMPAVDMDITANSTTVKGEASFSDLLESLDGGLAGEFTARNDRFSFQVDSLNYYFKQDIDAVVGQRQVTYAQNWLQGLIGYRIYETQLDEYAKVSFEPTVGYRYYWNRFTVEDATGAELADKNYNWGDVVFGGRMIFDLNEKLSFLVSGTYGGFDWGDSSKYSWTAAGAVDWHFSENKTLRVGYMILEFKKEKDKNGPVIDQASIKERLSGPVVSLIWHF